MTMDFQRFLNNLKVNKVFPLSIEISKWNNWNLVSCFDQKPDSYISDSVYMGIDKNLEIALFKALTEFCERTLSRESIDPVAKMTKRSDGFAAFPVLNSDFTMAKIEARGNALREATERFLWSTWWDQPMVEFQLKDALMTELKSDFEALIKEFNLVSVKEIQVDEDQGEHRLSIFLAETKYGGFVTGGACSKISDPMRRYNPAFGELMRHLIVVRKMNFHSYKSTNFYEKRLMGFGSGEWRTLVTNRLKVSGNNRVKLPALMVDQEVEHSVMNVIKIHRCLYEKQPPFIGGSLERLCI
jgi:hypothetical protein